MYYIYVIVQNKDVIWVGSSRSLIQRLSNHKEILGPFIDMLILESELTREIALEHEEGWIKRFSNLGCKLQNKNAPSGGANNRLLAYSHRACR
jgi:predicted GIY-YIG superfamily endonuclease